MSQVTFSVRSFKALPGKMDFRDLFNRVISGRGLIEFESTVEIVDPGNLESNEWELGYHQTVLSDQQVNLYSDSKGRAIYEHMVDTLLTPANDRVEVRTGSWRGWFTEPTKFSTSNKLLTVKAFDQPSSGGSYATTDKKATLTKTVLVGEFCTWLVARRADPNRSGGELRWLNWARWDIDLVGLVDAKHFKLTLAPLSAVRIVAQGGQGTQAPIVPAPDHIWTEKDQWFSLTGNRTLLKAQP
jgi:hypothetical protein